MPMDLALQIESREPGPPAARGAAAGARAGRTPAAQSRQARGPSSYLEYDRNLRRANKAVGIARGPGRLDCERARIGK